MLTLPPPTKLQVCTDLPSLADGDLIVWNASTKKWDALLKSAIILASGANAFAGDQSMGTHKLTNLGTPTASTDAATKGYVDGAVGVPGAYVQTDGTVPLTANWAVGSHKLTGVSDPTAAQDVATKNYVDSAPYVKTDGTAGLSANWDAGAHKITAQQLASSIADGTAPLIVVSTTKVANLNADFVDGKHSTDFALLDGTQAFAGDQSMGTHKLTNLGTPTASADAATKGYVDTAVSGGVSGSFVALDGSTPLTGNWDAGAHTITASQLVSSIADGTAPLIVTSTTKVTNLNADRLDGLDSTAFPTFDAHNRLSANAFLGTTSALGSQSSAATLNGNNGDVFTLTLTGNVTLTLSNFATNQKVLLYVTQDGTGSRTLTWPTIKAPSGTAPVLSTGAGKTDCIAIHYDGTNYFVSLVGNDYR